MNEMGTKIYKFSYMMNEKVAVSSLAPTQEIAEQRLRELFGKDEQYDLVSSTFSHNTGEYSIKDRERPTPVRRSSAELSVSEGEESLMDNVVAAYAKDKKVSL